MTEIVQFPELSLYDYSPYDERPKIVWPNGARLAFWVAPNIEFYELDPPINPHRQAWPHPYPPVPGYSIRDYGNRVGHQRQMALLDKYGVRGSISLSAALCEHHPEIIALCAERNWEFFSHGIYNTRYTYGLTEDQEREMIEDAMDTIERAVGQRRRVIWRLPCLIPIIRLICLPKRVACIPVIYSMMINRHGSIRDLVNRLYPSPIL